MEDFVKKIEKLHLNKSSGGIKKINSQNNYEHSMNIASHGMVHNTVNYDFNTMGW